MPQKAAQPLHRSALGGPLVVVLLVATVCLGIAPVALSQDPSVQAATPSATPTPARPAPKPGPIESDRDIISITLPRDQRPRDNDIRFDRISIEEGLSQSTVGCILQDHKGYMWFGTEDGLNKYDGYNFTVYRHDPQDPNSLSNNYVRCILEDYTGVLWIGTRGGGLDRLDPETEQFTHYKHDPLKPHSISDNNIQSIYEDGVGVLWIGTSEGGLDKFDRENDQFLHYRHDPLDPHSLSDGSVVAIHQDRTGELWIGTHGGGLNRLDRAQQQFIHYQHHPEDPQSLSSNQITFIHEDSEGLLWVGTGDGGMNRLDPETGRSVRYQNDPQNPRSLSSNEIQVIFEDHAGVLWVGTNGRGLDRYDRASDQFVHYVNDPLDRHSLSHNDVWSIYEDRGGVLWIGTFGGGVSKANPANQKFVHYHKDPSNPNTLSDNSVLAIWEDKSGYVWIGTHSGGLNRFDPQSGQWTHYQHDSDDPYSLSSSHVRSIYEDRHGVLWVGTDGGLDRLDRENQRFFHYRHDPGDPHSLSDNSIWPIFEDTSGTLWIGTLGGGLNKLNRASGQFTRYQHDPSDPHSLSHETVTSIYESYDGILWIATMGGGLNRLEPDSGRFTHYRHDPMDAQSLSNDRVFSITEDYRNRLYVGTWGGGLNRLDRRTGQFTHFREKDGLANDVVYGVLEDNTTYLWLSTNRGLSRFTSSSEKFRNYDVSDGLQSNEFSSGAYHEGASGVVYFGGINGFNAFYPPDVKDNPYPPPIVITAFSKFAETILRDISEDLEIELSYSDNFIAFEFAALDYTAPHKNQYLYRLEGFDPDWVSAGTRRYQSYSNLRGGDYIFRVKGSNSDGIWNREGLAIYITVTPPIWEEQWFQGGLVLLLLASVLAAYRLRLRNIEAHTRELESQVDERTYEIERRRLVAEGLREILVILNSNRSLRESLEYIASQGALLTGAAQAVVFQREENGSVVTALGSHARHAPGATSRVVPPGTVEWVAQAMQVQEPLIVPDIESFQASNLQAPPATMSQYRAVLGIPLSVGTELYGGLVLFYLSKRSFTEEDLELGLTLVDHAALAIANAQLRERVEQMATETERSRLARDLHDAVTQTLFSASLIAEVLPSTWECDPQEGRELLTELRQLSRGAMAEMRTLLLELRPAALAEATLGDLLRQLGEAMTGRTGTPVEVSLDGQCDLPDDVQVALYRIAQEALNNVVKHAHASQVNIRLRCTPVHTGDGDRQQHIVDMQITDNGDGFDASDIPPHHLGLRIIRERAQAIGARLGIDSRLGQGTRVTVVWTGTA